VLIAEYPGAQRREGGEGVRVLGRGIPISKILYLLCPVTATHPINRSISNSDESVDPPGISSLLHW
jgi:hypothetical protein